MPQALALPAGSLLACVDSIRQALAECRTDFERLVLRDHAKAVQEAARILKRRDIQTQASILVCDCERAIAKANPAKPEGGPGRGIKTVPREDGFSIPTSTIRNIRQAHKITDEEYAARKESAVESEEPLTRKALLNPAATIARNWTGETEWYTPDKYLDAARAVLGAFDLDPASSEFAQRKVQAARYFTAEDDGLAQEWAGRIWLNPPYKMPLIARFVEKLCTSDGRTEAILLTNNCTDTAWWHGALGESNAVCFTMGRISFYNAAGKSSAPTNGQCFFHMGARPERFADVFGAIGAVLHT